MDNESYEFLSKILYPTELNSILIAYDRIKRLIK